MTFKSILRSLSPQKCSRQKSDNVTILKVCDNDSLHDLSPAWGLTPVSWCHVCLSVCHRTPQTDIMLVLTDHTDQYVYLSVCFVLPG